MVDSPATIWFEPCIPTSLQIVAAARSNRHPRSKHVVTLRNVHPSFLRVTASSVFCAALKTKPRQFDVFPIMWTYRPTNACSRMMLYTEITKIAGSPSNRYLSLCLYTCLKRCQLGIMLGVLLENEKYHKTRDHQTRVFNYVTGPTTVDDNVRADKTSRAKTSSAKKQFKARGLTSGACSTCSTAATADLLQPPGAPPSPPAAAAAP